MTGLVESFADIIQIYSLICIFSFYTLSLSVCPCRGAIVIVIKVVTPFMLKN